MKSKYTQHKLAIGQYDDKIEHFIRAGIGTYKAPFLEAEPQRIRF